MEDRQQLILIILGILLFLVIIIVFILVNNAKKVSLYDTGVTAKYGDQLLTLSTCEYSQEDGRFAVVCKKIEDVQ